MAVLFSDGIVYRGCCFVVYPCLGGKVVLCWLWGRIEERGGCLIDERLLGVGWKLTYTLELMAVHVESCI